MQNIEEEIKNEYPQKRSLVPECESQMYKTISRDRWNDTRTAHPVEKFSNDTGLGWEELERKIISKRQVYLSQVGREDQVHVI